MLTLGNLPDQLPAWLPVEIQPFIPTLGLETFPYVAQVEPQPDGTFRRKVARADQGKGALPVTLAWIPDNRLPPHGFTFTVGKYKGTPVWDAPVHYLLWYAGEIVYTRYRQLDPEMQTVYRPEFLRLCDHLEWWAAMLYTEDRLETARKNISHRKAPYWARNPITLAMGNSSTLLRLSADASQRTTPPTDFELQISEAVAEMMDAESFSLDDLPVLAFSPDSQAFAEVNFWGA